MFLACRSTTTSSSSAPAMPAPKRPSWRLGWVRRFSSLPPTSTRSVRCPAIPPSAGSRRAPWSARSTPSAVSWGGRPIARRSSSACPIAPKAPPAGRAGDQPAVDIAQHIDALGLTAARFKTGTPPRVDGRSVDWSKVERQDGDGTAYRFSFYHHVELPRQLPCWVTWAGEEVKEIIRAHLQESALYGGAISGRGPRYCPSVEDKIVKFPD